MRAKPVITSSACLIAACRSSVSADQAGFRKMSGPSLIVDLLPEVHPPSHQELLLHFYLRLQSLPLWCFRLPIRQRKPVTNAAFNSRSNALRYTGALGLSGFIHAF